jgi:phage gp46-like protein
MTKKNPFDILMTSTLDGGDFIQNNNDLELSYSIANQIPLCLIGGNVDTPYWADSVIENGPLISNFEKTLNSVVLNSAGISKLVDSAKLDLKVLDIYADINVSGSIPSENRFQLTIEINTPEKEPEIYLYLFDNKKLI